MFQTHPVKTLKNTIKKHLVDFEVQVIPFGIFGTLNYPIFWLIWCFASHQSYENLWLRLIATLLCASLISIHYWPAKLKTWLPVYWVITLTFCLPFFFTFMLLKNHVTSVWLMSTTAVLFWLILLVDWVIFFLILVVGVSLAFIVFFLTDDSISNVDYTGVMYQYLGTLLVGIIFARNKQSAESAKLEGMRAIGSNVAHELRTPLTSIEAGIGGIKNYLPKLLDGYDKAKNSGLPVDFIAPNHYQLLITVLDRIEMETQYANTIIDMLLLKSKQNSLAYANFKLHSMDACITEALSRYPFQDKEKDLVKYHPENNFYFYGDSILMMHIFFNLIKNALYFIAKGQKGDIEIWLDSTFKENRVHFKDTAMGILKNLIPNIFNKFNTYTLHGTGLGLSFCKSTMNSFGGDISCESKYMEFTKFIMTFPKPNPESLQDAKQNS